MSAHSSQNHPANGSYNKSPVKGFSLETSLAMVAWIRDLIGLSGVSVPSGHTVGSGGQVSSCWSL